VGGLVLSFDFSLVPGLGEFLVTVGKDGLFFDERLVVRGDVSDGGVEAHSVVVRLFTGNPSIFRTLLGSQAMNPPSIIFYKQLGDLLLLEPAIAKLSSAYDKKVILMTRKEYAPLVFLMANVEISSFLPNQKVSKLISFTPTQRAALAAFLTKADSKVAVFKSLSVFRWWHRLTYTDGCLTYADSPIYRAKYFFEATPCEELQPYRPPILLSPPTSWCPSGIPESYVLVHATSAWKRKSWPIDKWAKLLDSLHWAGVGPIVCTSGMAEWERDFVRTLQSTTCASIINLAGKTDLRAYLALVARAKLVLSIDGSVSHIAAAFKRPRVTLFGPTNPAHWHYSSESAILISSRQFAKESPYSMSIIPFEVVRDAAFSLWCRK
jgi:ADP-heptose:LPS heptosyltransferase